MQYPQVNWARRRGGSSPCAKPSFEFRPVTKTDPAFTANDDMIVNRQVDFFGGFDESLRGLDIDFARFWISRRMVMRDDQGGRIEDEGPFQYFTRVDGGRGDRTSTDDFIADQAVLAVQKQHAHLFYRQARHGDDEIFDYVRGFGKAFPIEHPFAGGDKHCLPQQGQNRAGGILFI